MTRTTLITTLLALGLTTPALAGPGNGKAKGKVEVCHVPPGNPGAAKTLSIGAPALDAHLAHGDTEGPCSGVPPGDDDDKDRDDDDRDDDDRKDGPADDIEEPDDGPDDDIERPRDDIEGPADDIEEDEPAPTRKAPTRKRKADGPTPTLEDLRKRAERVWKRAQNAFADLF